MKYAISTLALLVAIFAIGQTTQDSTKSTFSIYLSSESCKVDMSLGHLYTEEIDEAKGIRIIYANGIPEHKTGVFPNHGNPNTISAHQVRYEIPLQPIAAAAQIPGMGIRTGILFSGVELDPFTGEFFIGKNGPNRDWNITTLTTAVNLGLDCNNAHVQPTGKYHYHGTPNAYLEELGVDGSKMIKLGYAADGYPIYYKYAYNASGELQPFESGYALKEGERPGDGINAPNGVYDGTYFQDYEYRNGLSELDACNGRTGKTPESESEYYYLITDNFPSSPICFHAEPSKDFNNFGGEAPVGEVQNQGPSRGQGMPPRGGNRPSGEETMRMMDTNKDRQISKSEAKGPLQQDFDRLDSNKDGFLSLTEIESGMRAR